MRCVSGAAVFEEQRRNFEDLRAALIGKICRVWYLILSKQIIRGDR